MIRGTTFESVLSKYLAWVSEHAPGVQRTIRPGLTAAELADFEQSLGIELPENLRLLYRRLDGQEHWGESLLPALLPALQPLIIMSSSVVVTDRRDRLAFVRDVPAISQTPYRATGPVKPVYWNPFWIPVGADGGAGTLVVDLDPPEGGQAGQVIAAWDDHDERVVLYDGLLPLFETVLEGIETGRYGYKNGYGIVDK
jgi:cell wall assembly regulator SMI1